MPGIENKYFRLQAHAPNVHFMTFAPAGVEAGVEAGVNAGGAVELQELDEDAWHPHIYDMHDRRCRTSGGPPTR